MNIKSIYIVGGDTSGRSPRDGSYERDITTKKGNGSSNNISSGPPVENYSSTSSTATASGSGTSSGPKTGAALQKSPTKKSSSSSKSKNKSREGKSPNGSGSESGKQTQENTDGATDKSVNSTMPKGSTFSEKAMLLSSDEDSVQ